MFIELKRKGEIRGYGDNFKVVREEGNVQASLLEISGVKKKSRGHKMSVKSDQYVAKIGREGGSKRFMEFLSSKPMDKYLSAKTM
jgi:hypothetical protein